MNIRHLKSKKVGQGDQEVVNIKGSTNLNNNEKDIRKIELEGNEYTDEKRERVDNNEKTDTDKEMTGNGGKIVDS